MAGQSIGYIRVSTLDQQTERQLDGIALDQTFTDKASGKDTKRPQLELLLRFARRGDTVVVWRLDRLSRSLPDLIGLVQTMREGNAGLGVAAGIQLKSITEAIDTTTATGELVFHIFAALAQFEHRLIRERTRAGPFPLNDRCTARQLMARAPA